MSFYANLTIKQKQVVWAWTFLSLPILFYCVIRFYPTLNAITLSFQEWNLLGDRTWAGVDNYAKLFADPVFWKVFKNTFIYLLLGTPSGQSALYARHHQSALLSPLYDISSCHGVALALVLSACADWPVQQCIGQCWHSAVSLPVLNHLGASLNFGTGGLGRFGFSNHHLYGRAARHSANLL